MQPMSYHEEISTGLLRGLGHSMQLTMIVLLPWFLSCSCLGGLICSSEDQVDFWRGRAFLSFSFSTFYLRYLPVMLTIIIINTSKQASNCCAFYNSVKHLLLLSLTLNKHWLDSPLVGKEHLLCFSTILDRGSRRQVT